MYNFGSITSVVGIRVDILLKLVLDQQLLL